MYFISEKLTFFKNVIFNNLCLLKTSDKIYESLYVNSQEQEKINMADQVLYTYIFFVFDLLCTFLHFIFSYYRQKYWFH